MKLCVGLIYAQIRTLFGHVHRTCTIIKVHLELIDNPDKLYLAKSDYIDIMTYLFYATFGIGSISGNNYLY